MSIQKRSWITKKGVQYRYYACVWNPGTNKPIYGKQRKKRKEAVLDESQILKELLAAIVLLIIKPLGGVLICG